MSPEELIAAAEAKVQDAEKNLDGCVVTLNTHKARNGGVPNVEVMALAQAQTLLGQAYATLAMAKMSQRFLAIEEAAKPAPAPEVANEAEARDVHDAVMQGGA